ncbi:MAG: hypothetical protein EON91_14005 [Brevundimonas sp.]|uniref:hypothetical protein n=1 Tax=Brevundimonas sp. TaxID=1871086 RepID=UPI00121A5BC3|nr:hypothetical protein [Brevundimonas sp.]RZJ16229.1 MAG: hypothetical protein EON91_14005 [Brevundimonas sp.]
MKILLTLIAIAGLTGPAVAQTVPDAAPEAAPETVTAASPTVPAPAASPQSEACTAQLAEIARMRLRQQSLQAQLQGNGQASEQNARNTQATVRAGQATAWATGLASLVPGVGFVASAASGAATGQAIMAQQRAAQATNAQATDIVGELVPLSQRLHALETQALTDGCI